MWRRKRRYGATKRRSYGRRRTFGRRRFGGRKTYRRRNYKPRNGEPTAKMVKHIYHQIYTVDPAAPGVGTALNVFAVYGGNCLYQPDLTAGTSVTHQPMGFDNHARLFDHYQVVKSYLKVTVSPRGPTADEEIAAQEDPQMYGIYKSDKAVPISAFDANLVIEDGRGTHKVVTAINGRSVTLKSYFNRKRDLGKGLVPLTRGTRTSNPSEIYYWQLYNTNMAGSDHPASCIVDLTITFYALWTEKCFMDETAPVPPPPG